MKRYLEALMYKINICEAKTNLSKYIKKLENGEEEEIIIYRYNKPVATISLYKKKKSIIGCGKDIPGIDNFELKKGFEDIPELFGY